MWRCGCCSLLQLALVGLVAQTSVARELQVLVKPDNQISNGPPDLPLKSSYLELDDPQLARTVIGFQPEGVHITPWQYTPEGWTMLVTWQTGAPIISNATEQPEPSPEGQVKGMVEFGREPTKLEYSVPESKNATYTYSYGDGCGSLTYQSPILHHALLQRLQPGESYYYRVGNDKDGWSEVLPLKVTPTLDQGPLRIGVVSDVGQTHNSSTTLQHLTSNQPDIVLLPGDLVYADHYSSNGTFLYNNCTDQRRWDSWARLTSPLFSSVPLLTSPGNHEVEVQLDNGNMTFVAYNARYPVPQDPSVISTEPNAAETYLDPTNWAKLLHEAEVVANNSYYSLDFPGVHLISLSNYISYGEASRQYQWLLEDIASVDRELTPWLLVQFHTAPYHTYNHHYKEVEQFMQLYEPVFYQHNVNLVLGGHLHSYERSRPVYNYTVDTCAPAYLCIGDGGNLEGLQTEYIDQNPIPECADPSTFDTPYYQPSPLGHGLVTLQDGSFCPSSQPPHSAYREPSFGHGMLTLLNATHAQWEWFRNQDGQATATDSALLVRNLACMFKH